MKLADLRADHVEQMLAAMSDEGRGDRTRRLTLAVLSSALGTAMKRRLIPWNVCGQVELAPGHKEPRKVWDEEETRRFLRYVRDDRLYALWRLYALAGLRRGEALALDWSNVDLDGGTLTVRRTLSETGGRMEWGTPKSQNSVRTIPIDLDTVAALRSHHARQAEEKLALGAGYSDHDLVFAREDGAPIWPGKISKRFHALRGGVETAEDSPPRPSPRCRESHAWERSGLEDHERQSRPLRNLGHRRPLRACASVGGQGSGGERRRIGPLLRGCEERRFGTRIGVRANPATAFAKDGDEVAYLFPPRRGRAVAHLPVVESGRC